MPTLRPLSLVALTVALLAAACGDGAPTTGSAADRVVEIEMRDIAFSPVRVDVDAGETVRFVFTNVGEVAHEAYVGDEAAQHEHASEMESMDGMDHGDGEALVVEPGDTGELTYTFDDEDIVQIGCHQPGHFATGMMLDVVVG